MNANLPLDRSQMRTLAGRAHLVPYRSRGRIQNFVTTLTGQQHDSSRVAPLVTLYPAVPTLALGAPARVVHGDSGSQGLGVDGWEWVHALAPLPVTLPNPGASSWRPKGEHPQERQPEGCGAEGQMR